MRNSTVCYVPAASPTQTQWDSHADRYHLRSAEPVYMAALRAAVRELDVRHVRYGNMLIARCRPRTLALSATLEREEDVFAAEGRISQRGA